MRRNLDYFRAREKLAGPGRCDYDRLLLPICTGIFIARKKRA
jgi:hypothetical protein